MSMLAMLMLVMGVGVMFVATTIHGVVIGCTFLIMSAVFAGVVVLRAELDELRLIIETTERLLVQGSQVYWEGRDVPVHCTSGSSEIPDTISEGDVRPADKEFLDKWMKENGRT